MKALKEQLKACDLYGYEVVTELIKESGIFNFVSYRKGSVPSLGSLTVKIEYFKPKNNGIKVIKCIFHRNNEITVVTDMGYIRFCR